MSALATELFREVRPGLFRVLAGKNAATYVDVLDSLEAETSQRHEGMSREEALGIVGAVLANHPDFVPDDGEMQHGLSEEFASLPPRERARRVLDYLARKDVGWLEDVQLPDWQRRIRFDTHGANRLPTGQIGSECNDCVQLNQNKPGRSGEADGDEPFESIVGRLLGIQ